MRSKLPGLAVTLLLLAGTFALFEFTDLDLRLQDHCYDFGKHRWRVEKQDTGPRLLFYTGPKVVLAVTGGILIAWLLLPVRWRPTALQNFQLPWPHRRLWFILICLAAVPATIGLMKARSDLYCPWSIDRYGGDRPHLHFFEALPANYPPDCGKCFPAGHASGGFALLSLYYLGTSRRGRWLGLMIGMTAGWALGIYQMLKGAHFLSHTVVTMLIAALLVQALAWLLKIDAPKALAARDNP
jgi:membrane-associated PAP2 superfamily phosphatase